MTANLAILGFFKYCNFFLTSIDSLLRSMGLGHFAISALDIILPAGISFYTFQAMSYTIDIYRNKAEPIDDFRDFALFVCFFPHLVAGPIMRAHTLLPQVMHQRRLKPGDLAEGALLVLIGLFKKLVIADNMAPIANAVFFRYSHGTATYITGPQTLIAVYAFAFQIYGDFSGYSSIARGISKWLGFELVVNFRMPYLAVSPSDFWQRWHISLSSWLRDYLYIPLGGNRGSQLATYRNLMLTMLLGGLWHGASWTFVAWGLFHGVVLCLFRLLNIRDPKPHGKILQRAQWAGQVLLMFHITCIGWLIFRADTMGSAFQMLKRITTNLHFTGLAGLILLVFYCAPLFAFEWTMDGENQIWRAVRASWLAKSLILAYLLFMLFIFHASNTYEFIYFQF